LNSGHKLWCLADFYCEAIADSGIEFDMLYGPAYKGIPLVVATAIRYAANRSDYPYAFNRKESKDHGEKGMLVGAPLQGNVLIIDDVITSGISVRESVEIITQHGAKPCGIVIALDRMEKGENSDQSAVQEVMERYQIPVIAVANIQDVIGYLEESDEFAEYQAAVKQYRDTYGVDQ
jgi:orotate phosphoribosyltransferase